MNKVVVIIISILIIIVIGFLLININSEIKNENESLDIVSSEENIISENEDKLIEKNEIKEESDLKVENIKIKVNNEVLNVRVEENSATEALIEKLKQGDITVNAHGYGDFEQVGSLGFNLPTSDKQITTKEGDVMLYQGNQITIFYGKNSWSYTKLGEIIGEERNRLKEILGNETVTLILSID